MIGPSPPALLKSVAERYRNEGYDVIIEPGSGAVPFDLGGYTPDLIARKSDLAVIVEVKTQAERMSFDQLRSVVDEVRRHKGWKFVLVTSQDVLAFALPAEDEDQLSWDEVGHRIKDAQRLSDLGEKEAAFLILWIAFERMMRFEARRIALPVDRLAPAILIRQLYSQGELSMAQFDAALRSQDVRDRIIHGFRASDLNDAVARLGTVVRELLEQWSALSVER
jgi:Holliday junction resolvase